VTLYGPEPTLLEIPRLLAVKRIAITQRVRVELRGEFLNAGDVVKIEIERIGTLSNRIV